MLEWLAEEVVSTVLWEILVGTAETCYEVIFESMGGPFGAAAAVNVGWGST
jgi:hypothetical protein